MEYVRCTSPHLKPLPPPPSSPQHPSITLQLLLRPLPQLPRKLSIRSRLARRFRQHTYRLVQFAVDDARFVARGGPEHVVAALFWGDHLDAAVWEGGGDKSACFSA